jgi:hypothetical protein
MAVLTVCAGRRLAAPELCYGQQSITRRRSISFSSWYAPYKCLFDHC